MMPNILRLCFCNMFYMCVPLAIIAESYAQVFVIFDKFYQSSIKGLHVCECKSRLCGSCRINVNVGHVT